MLLFIFLKNKTSIKREIQQRIPEKLKLRQRRQPFSTVDSCFQTCLSRVNIHHLLMNTIFFPVKFFVLTSHLVFLLKINSIEKYSRSPGIRQRFSTYTVFSRSARQTIHINLILYMKNSITMQSLNSEKNIYLCVRKNKL